ncbi:hypothetical protein [Paraburkholderia silvatlantica]|uniref:Uncharacterized protein n=1 Tax=Paraburkholderia silvatlantica TaxID=321895 RepID=A0A2U1A481_9BURK|nr:hypothetical protein [Paraburkholderia silvatlantica]MBB2931674.1 hypothetical protein [Paraburkholderia silvatlantica]PVY26322.1 hypothetical protein C7411_1243 [Paraburkholderia silvatlantica]PXW32073.1 hypothetical protein C7413_1233 [Paraburkholderia silvatlantica]PYE18934.1 hypothetical protein C7410_121128 [Paraburkholderia silvatlantica]TDQ82653.1 hypothetical protein C7412_1236 [Paraburkholderia silvatlantica]
MPQIDIARVPKRRGAGYPPSFDTPCAEHLNPHPATNRDPGAAPDIIDLPFNEDIS